MQQTLDPPRSGQLSSAPVEALPHYFPALDGVRAFAVLFVVYEHVLKQPSPLLHFHGWLGVDAFFVLSGFLITSLLFREERLTGRVDMAAFYIRRAFRILPLYWIVLAIYVIMLAAQASQHVKWVEMKHALPFFLTFNNDIPLLLMPDRVGTVFGLSWTLGIEEKFYFLWPLLCFVAFKTLRSRVTAGVAVYAGSLALSVLSFKMGRGYAGLSAGALLAALFSSRWLPRVREIVRRVPPAAILVMIVVGFALVDVNIWFVFFFGWIIALLIANVLLRPSWLSRGLSWKPLVWLGKRSYAMYLIQGFALEALLHVTRWRGPGREVALAIAAFGVAAMAATILHGLVEEPARKAGRRLIASRA